MLTMENEITYDIIQFVLGATILFVVFRAIFFKERRRRLINDVKEIGGGTAATVFAMIALFAAGTIAVLIGVVTDKNPFFDLEK